MAWMSCDGIDASVLVLVAQLRHDRDVSTVRCTGEVVGGISRQKISSNFCFEWAMSVRGRVISWKVLWE